MEDVIEPIPKTMEKIFGCKGKLVKPSVVTVQSLVSKIKKGELLTIVDLGKAIAQKYSVDAACPAATLKALQLLSKQDQSVNYWRVIKPKGELISKFPGGVEGHAERLQEEGWEIDFSKKVPQVLAFENKLSMLV